MTELTETSWARSGGARCDECGLNPHDFHDREMPAAVRAMGERWVIFVDATSGQRGGDAALRSRPEPNEWSPVALACHVRDLLAISATRLEQMVADDRPNFAPWDYEAAATDLRYREQNPRDVAADIGVNADRFAELMRHAPSRSHMRTATLQGHEFTVSELARFVLHEGHHHLIQAVQATQTTEAR